MAKPSNGIKTDVNLNEEFMVSCLGGGGKLNIGEAGLSCSMPNGEIVKPASSPPAGPKK